MTPLGEWCAASGSDDEYWSYEWADQVQCHECERYLYLTTRLRLPRHKTRTKSMAQPS